MMRRPRSLNDSTAGSFPFLLVLVVTSSFLSGRCLATTDSHHRRPPAGRHGPPRPVSPPSPPPPPATTFSVLQYGAVGDGDKDDTKAFVDAWSAACAVRSSTVVVPAGYRFVVGPVTFTGDSCQPNTVFQLDGTIVANTDSGGWCSGNAVQQWLEFRSCTGLTIQGSGTVDGQGSHWWSGGAPATDIDADRVGTNNRPTALRVYESTNVAVTGITIQNSARFHLTFDTCRAVEVRGVAIRSPGDSPNTDGIHLAGSVGVSIQNATVACGDDCVSIQDGCSRVLVRGVTCGPGHGISIGGLGKGGATAVVSDVTVQDVSLVGTSAGVRIKTWQGGSGSVRGVLFSGVRVSAVKTPIVIDQYYCDHATCANQTAAVAVSGVAYSGITGTYTQRPVYLACSDAAPCAGLRLEDIKLAPVKDGGYGRLYGPFCWKAYGDEVRPVVPPVDCLMAGEP
ncbi:polygalacturonase At1g48100-like [Oryza glaberrima]|uniref:polygalacturonase At1g48100-like n=1 Tax=Oryza glaberrima TaxID=4538 RepID=UPI00224C23A9|nr:polygalacturonase At1g48100-like [Oryza glaberrima]